MENNALRIAVTETKQKNDSIQRLKGPTYIHTF